MFGETCQIAKFCAFYCMNYSYKKERGAGGGEEVQEGGATCTPTAESCCCMAEINTIV